MNPKKTLGDYIEVLRETTNPVDGVVPILHMNRFALDYLDLAMDVDRWNESEVDIVLPQTREAVRNYIGNKAIDVLAISEVVVKKSDDEPFVNQTPTWELKIQQANEFQEFMKLSVRGLLIAASQLWSVVEAHIVSFPPRY